MPDISADHSRKQIADRRLAVVTAGLGGIGSGIPMAMVQREFEVVGCDHTIASIQAKRLTSSAPDGVPLSRIAGGIADVDDHPRFIDASFSAFRRIDFQVNNARASVRSRSGLLDFTLPSYGLNFAANIRGAFFLTLEHAHDQSRPDMLRHAPGGRLHPHQPLKHARGCRAHGCDARGG